LFAHGYTLKHRFVLFSRHLHEEASEQNASAATLSQRPLVVCAAAADTVRWFCVESTVISTPNHYSSWHFFIKSRVSLYISVIIYSWTLCKWLNCSILDMDTKKKITLSEILNVIHEVEAKSMTSQVENESHLWLAS
jgi:hypothetical protein